MENSAEKKTGIDKAGEDLFSFAVDREDVKALVANLPEETDIQGVTVEYELQILKIISVGWSISYYLEKSPQKTQLAELYWQTVQQFSESLSSSTELMTGHAIDYFQILKDRLAGRRAAVQKGPLLDHLWHLFVLLKHRIAQRSAHPLQDRRLQQKRSHSVRLAVEHFVHQIIHDIVVAAGERLDESGKVILSLHRDGSHL